MKESLDVTFEKLQVTALRVKSERDEFMRVLRWAHEAINRISGPQMGPKGKDFGLELAIREAFAKAGEKL